MLLVKTDWIFKRLRGSLCPPQIRMSVNSAVYAVAQYSRYDQRQMLKERDAKIEILVEAELEIEVGVELEEVAAMLNSKTPDFEALRMRLDYMEDRLRLLEPIIAQTGERKEGSSFPRQEGKATASQQVTDLPKADVGSITKQKN